MARALKVKEPFRFYTRVHLSELTGLRASNLSQLLSNLKKVDGACIYHHTHRFLQQHQYLSPEPPNDFAWWVNEVLDEHDLGEKLASIDTIQFPNIRSLKEKIIQTVSEYLKSTPQAKKKFADDGEDFHFIRSTSFVLPTNYFAHDLKEFIKIMRKITIDSIYFHIFEARLRLEKKTNDFSNWIEESFGDTQLAERISRLDPYTYTLEDLRNKIIRILKQKLTK